MRLAKRLDDLEQELCDKKRGLEPTSQERSEREQELDRILGRDGALAEKVLDDPEMGAASEAAWRLTSYAGDA